MAEYWKLIYEPCGHDLMFPRTGPRLFDDDEVERVVRRYYGSCDACARHGDGTRQRNCPDYTSVGDLLDRGVDLSTATPR